MRLTAIFALLALIGTVYGFAPAAALVPSIVGIGASLMAAMNHDGAGSELFSNWSPFAHKYESHEDTKWLSREHHGEYQGHSYQKDHHSYQYEGYRRDCAGPDDDKPG